MENLEVVGDAEQRSIDVRCKFGRVFAEIIENYAKAKDKETLDTLIEFIKDVQKQT